MITENQIDSIIGRDVRGTDGEKIGRAGQVYLDDQTGRPEWVTVHTGLFGTNESFVPLAGAELTEDAVTVPFTKQVVKDAPNVDPAGGHLSLEEEEQLHRYYGVEGGDAMTSDAGMDAGMDDGMDDATGDAPLTGGTDDGRTVGHDTSGPTTDEAMTLSEERLDVGTQTREAGRARLRKYVTTEEQTVTVPVTKEHVRVVTEPITEDNLAEATSGPEISEEEHEVVLHEEVPVLQTEVVPVERVRLEKEVETVQEQVSGTVRKEHVEREDDDAGRVPDERTPTDRTAE